MKANIGNLTAQHAARNYCVKTEEFSGSRTNRLFMQGAIKPRAGARLALVGTKASPLSALCRADSWAMSRANSGRSPFGILVTVAVGKDKTGVGVEDEL